MEKGGDMVKKKEKQQGKTQLERQGKTIGILVIISIVLFLCINNVSAVPPVSQIQQFAEGYSIEGSPQEIIKQGRDFQYNFFVYNISDGLPISNKTTKCFFYMANDSGTVKTYAEVMYFPENYWGVLLNKANFTTLGFHPYGVKCNSSDLGGAFVSYFDVTMNGKAHPSDLVIVLFIIAFVVIIGFSIYEMYMMITHVFLLTYDVIDFAKAGGIYFAILGLNLMQVNFLGNQDIANWFTLFIQIGLWTNIIIPAISLAFTLMLGDWIKLNRIKKANG